MRSTIRSNTNNINYFLELIADLDNEYGIEFDHLKPYTTAGDIRPPYPYQWVATTKPRPGDDDPFEGVGGTPLEAVRNLWKDICAVLEGENETTSMW